MSSDASALPGPSATGPVARRPLAVVWCRQVDNEAQSPGYTSLPTEFEGHRETLEAVRSVGHIAINLADTHDYWDPEPGTTLAFYPNLFLYPAFGGRYTCVGRMFLSKEDRPRLGMKTFVVETASLLHPGEFGPAVLRWHAQLGEKEGGVASPVGTRDRDLFGPVGEGLLFPDGARDPRLLIASARWESAMTVLLQLVRALPSSIVAPGAILTFPYFVPPLGLDLDELQRRIPLSLLLMREPRQDAESPRHARRVQSWRAEKVTVRDLAIDASPAPTRGKESLPTLMRYLREGNDRRLGALRARVDAVELPRQIGRRPDGTKWSAIDRRKEIGRIAEAMEGTALLLERPQGRIALASLDARRRSQDYLRAVPASRPPSPPAAAVAGPRHHPATLSDAGKSTASATEGGPPKGAPRDSVPVPRKQLHPLAPPTHAPAIPERPAGARSAALSSLVPPPNPDLQLADLLRALEERVTTRLADGLRSSAAEAREAANVASAATSAALRRQEETLSALRERLEGKLDAAEAVPKARLEELDREIRSALDAGRAERAALEARLTKVLAVGSAAPRGSSPSSSAAESQAIHRRIEESEGRLKVLAEARAKEQSRVHLEAVADLQTRMQDHIEARLSQALEEERQRSEALVARLRSEMDALLRSAAASSPGAPPKAVAARSAEFEKLEATFRTELADLRNRTDQLTTRLIPIVRQAWAKIEELERRQGAAMGAGAPSEEGAATPPPPETAAPARKGARRSANG